jgi:predicted MFS family arabinose efflux permease
MSTTDSPRRFGRQLAIIFAARTILNTAHRIIYPFLPSLARGLDISLATASGLISVRLVAGLAAPFFGPLSDRFGRRRTMEIGLLLFTLAGGILVATGALTGVNPTIAAATLAFALFGLAKVVYDPAVHAYVGDSVPYRERARAVGTVEFSWSTAWLLGVPASGFLIERLGWRAPWALLIGLGVLSLWLTHRGLPAGHRSPVPGDGPLLRPSWLGRWRALLSRRPVVILLLSSLLLTAASEIPFIVYGAWFETSYGLGLSSLGLASIVVGLAEAGGELGTTTLTDRFGKKRSVVAGLVGLALGLALLPWLAGLGLAAALAGLVLVTLGFEFSIVSLLPLATELAPDARASLLALNLTAMSLGRILGATLGSGLWTWLGGGIAANAWAGAACALLATLLMAWGMAEIEE